MSTTTYSEAQTVYVVLNHNSTVLGQFDSRVKAEKEAAYYRHETGNAAFVDEIVMFKREETEDA